MRGREKEVVVLVMLIKLIVRVRHALMTYPQQSYDVSVHVYTYTKLDEERGSSVVERRTRNQVSPGSNPPL